MPRLPVCRGRLTRGYRVGCWMPLQNSSGGIWAVRCGGWQVVVGRDAVGVIDPSPIRLNVCRCYVVAKSACPPVLNLICITNVAKLKGLHQLQPQHNRFPAPPSPPSPPQANSLNSRSPSAAAGGIPPDRRGDGSGVSGGGGRHGGGGGGG